MALTQKQILEEVRAAGMVAYLDPDTREYRVTFKASEVPDYGKREAVAAYCGHDDVIGTAKAMREHANRYGV